MKLLVVIPTTGGPALVRRLKPRPELPAPTAFVDGDYRPLSWSSDYARLAGAGGPVARALGQAAMAPHELRLDRSFDAGRSWEAPVAAAHLLLASGRVELVDAPEAAEVVLWTTGAVDLDLGVVGGDYAVAEKLERSTALFDAARRATIILALPQGAADAETLGRPGVRVLRATSVIELVDAVLGAADSADAPASRRRRWAAPVIGLAVAASALAAGVGWMMRDGAAPPPAIKPPPAPATVSALRIEELRAPAGSGCAGVLFGSAAAERRELEADASGALPSSRLDGALCGLSFRALSPDATVRLAGDLAAASVTPRPEPDGGVTYLLRSGLDRKLVYEIQAVSKDGGRIVERRAHEIAP